MYRLNVRCDDLWVGLVAWDSPRFEIRGLCALAVTVSCVLVPCVCSRLPPVFLNHVGAY